MAIKVTSPASDSERLNKEEASYYAKIGATSGQITITQGNAQLRRWDNRSGWVHISLWVLGMDLPQGGIIGQIVGNGGLVLPNNCLGIATKKSDNTAIPCIVDIDASGQIKVRNNLGINMADVLVDVTLPARNV